MNSQTFHKINCFSSLLLFCYFVFLLDVELVGLEVAPRENCVACAAMLDGIDSTALYIGHELVFHFIFMV